MKTDKELRQDWRYLADCLHSELYYFASDIDTLLNEGNKSIDKLCDESFEGHRPKALLDLYDCDLTLYAEARHIEAAWDWIAERLANLRSDVMQAAVILKMVLQLRDEGCDTETIGNIIPELG